MNTQQNRALRQGKAIYKDIESMLTEIHNSETISKKKHAERELQESHCGVTIERDYVIILAGGGPANRIYGTINDDGELETAELQHQDWFTPWERTPGQKEDLLLEYARKIVNAPIIQG
jgi:hypothetical protein